MYIPLVRERVRVKGRSGEFHVLRANYERQVADLADGNDSHLAIEDVPFASLFALFEDSKAERLPPESQKRPSGGRDKSWLRARG